MWPVIGRAILWMGAGVLFDRVVVNSTIGKSIGKTLKEGSGQMMDELKKDLGEDEKE